MREKYICVFLVLIFSASSFMAQDIHKAAGQGDVARIEELLEKNPECLNAKDDQGNTALHYAAFSGQKAAAEFLIAHGADVDLSNIYHYTPLHYAILGKHLEIAGLLARSGARINTPNVWGLTPLHTCASLNMLKEANFLLGYKAEVNIQDEFGETPLFSSVKSGHRDMILLLIKNGADVNVKDKVGRTPVFAAAATNAADILQLLIDRGAKTDVADQSGMTPLHRAAIAGHRRIAQILVRSGVNVNSRDTEGKSPYSYAAQYGHNTLMEWLMSMGAQPDVLAGDRGYFFFSELDLKAGEAVVWYLGHSGWAVKTKNHFLVFDYYEKTDRPDDPRLVNGRINPTEIYDQNVYVFVTHRHADHFDKTILEWRHSVPSIKFIFGWEALDDPDYHYMGPKKRLSLDRMEIECVHSPEAGEIEGNFLVKVDGIVIYHSGDYSRGHDVFKKDMQDLAQTAKDIDLFFMLAGNPMDNAGALYALQTVKPKFMFPMHAGGNEHVYKEFADFVGGKKIKTEIICAENRGDRFKYSQGRIKRMQ